MLYSHVKMMFVMLNCQNKTHISRNFANLLAFCNLSTTRNKLVSFIKFQGVEIRLIATGHLRACCDILKRPVTNLWITSVEYVKPCSNEANMLGLFLKQVLY